MRLHHFIAFIGSRSHVAKDEHGQLAQVLASNVPMFEDGDPICRAMLVEPFPHVIRTPIQDIDCKEL